MKSITLTPAYGRDYTSKAKVQAAYDLNHDFILNDITSPWDGKYINREDIEKNYPPGTWVQIRYKRNTGLHVFQI